jgi:hypothetical protein
MGHVCLVLPVTVNAISQTLSNLVVRFEMQLTVAKPLKSKLFRRNGWPDPWIFLEATLRPLHLRYLMDNASPWRGKLGPPRMLIATATRQAVITERTNDLANLMNQHNHADRTTSGTAKKRRNSLVDLCRLREPCQGEDLIRMRG